MRSRPRFCERVVRFLQNAVPENRLQVPHPASRAVHSFEKFLNFLSCESTNYRALQFLKFRLSFNLNGRLLKAHNIPTCIKLWSGRRESNPRPPAIGYQLSALSKASAAKAAFLCDS